MSKLQSLLSDISTKGHTPDRLLEIAVLYDNLKQYGSAYIFYLRFLESFELGYNITLSQSQDLLKYNSKQGEKIKIAYCVYIRLGLICEKMNDRVFNATLWYERAINYRPDLPFAYYFMSRIIEQQGKDIEWRWQKSFNYANLGCSTIGNYLCQAEKYLNLLNSEFKELNINYPGHYALFFQRSVAASWLKDYRTTAIEDLRFILRTFNNIDEIHYNCTLRNLENLTGIPQYSKSDI